MEIVHDFIYQPLCVIKAYVLEFVLSKSNIFNQGKALEADEFIYRFQKYL